MIQVLVILLVYVIGPLAVFTWAVRRYRSGVKPDFYEIAAISVATLLIGLLVWAFSGSVTDQDNADVDKVVAELIQRYPFPVKARYQDRPALSGEATNRDLEIRVYGVTDRTEQNKVIDIAEKLRRENISKPIQLLFFSEEIWEERADGTRIPHREQEQLLSRYLVQ